MHMTGGYSVASAPERWEWLQSEYAVYQTLGIHARLATAEEIVDMIAIHNSIRDKQAKRTDFFNFPEDQIDEEAENIANKIASMGNSQTE